VQQCYWPFVLARERSCLADNRKKNYLCVRSRWNSLPDPLYLQLEQFVLPSLQDLPLKTGVPHVVLCSAQIANHKLNKTYIRGRGRYKSPRGCHPQWSPTGLRLCCIQRSWFRSQKLDHPLRLLQPGAWSCRLGSFWFEKLKKSFISFSSAFLAHHRQLMPFSSWVDCVHLSRLTAWNRTVFPSGQLRMWRSVSWVEPAGTLNNSICAVLSSNTLRTSISKFPSAARHKGIIYLGCMSMYAELNTVIRDGKEMCLRFRPQEEYAMYSSSFPTMLSWGKSWNPSKRAEAIWNRTKTNELWTLVENQALVNISKMVF
jgi:hypothetical protein